MNQSGQATSSTITSCRKERGQKSTLIDKTRLFFFSSSCLLIPRCKKDDDNPIIKGTPRRYNEAECNLRRAYSDLFRITNPCYLRIQFSRQTPGTSVFLDSNASGAPNDNFRKNICSEDDLRSRIFGTFVVKFLACLPLLGFSDI